MFFACSQDFKVVEMTSQKWSGGAAGSGRGVDYTLKLVCNKKIKRLKFNKLWVGKEAFDAVVDSKVKQKKRFLKNDTIIVTASKQVKLDQYGYEVTEDAIMPLPPVQFSTPAMLVYKVRRKYRYLFVKEIRELDKLNMP